MLTGCSMAALELPNLHISLSLKPSDCMQASTKAKATRKEIFKRAEQYVQEYRAQVIWAWGDGQWSEAALFWNLHKCVYTARRCSSFLSMHVLGRQRAIARRCFLRSRNWEQWEGTQPSQNTIFSSHYVGSSSNQTPRPPAIRPSSFNLSEPFPML
jgi:hypothetical protein